jgi:hypothetical protein
MPQSSYFNATALPGTYTAGAALTAYTFVTIGVDRAVAVATSGSSNKGQFAYAIPEDYANGVDGVTLYHGGAGFAKVNGSGTAIAAGDPLKTGASGILIKATAEDDIVVATALEPSTASGDVIEVLLNRYVLGA